MLGKTHVVGSLAVIHVGLLGYEWYAERQNEAIPPPAEPVTLWGVQMGEPLSLTEYSLVTLILLSFVLLLLRVGNGRMYTCYLLVLLLGLCLTWQFGSSYSFTVALLLLFFTLGSLLPDIDSENSTLGRYVTPISRLIPHRTYTHTIWVVVLMMGVAWYIESVYVFALALGYTLHILQDSFSKQGIRWFYPFSMRKRGRRFVTYRTGGTGETALFYIAIVIHGLCAGYALWA